MNTSRLRASDSPSDPLRSESAAIPKSIVGVGELERRTGEPDPGAGRHAGDVGDGEELGRRAVQACGARRPDPDADRQRRVGDPLQQLGHHVVADDGAPRVDLQHQRLRALLVGPLDRVVDLVDDDVVEQPADLQHVDRADRRRRPAPRRPRPPRRRTTTSTAGRPGEQADR